MDARFTGYEFYQCLNYPIFFSSIGDCPDRYVLRLNEIIESCRIIYAIPYPLFNSFSFICYSIFNTTLIEMELLMKEFLIRFPLPQSVCINLRISIESTKGIVTIYISTL